MCWETLFFPHVRFCSWPSALSVAIKFEWLLLVRAYGASVFLSFHVSCRQLKPTAIKSSQYNKLPCGWCMPHGVFCLLLVILGNYSVAFCHPVPLFSLAAFFPFEVQCVFWEKDEAFLLGEVTNVIGEHNQILQINSSLHLWFSSFFFRLWALNVRGNTDVHKVSKTNQQILLFFNNILKPVQCMIFFHDLRVHHMQKYLSCLSYKLPCKE